MILEILNNFEGIIGAILGVVATMIVSFILKKIGKVYIKSRDYRIVKYSRDGYGAPIETNDYALVDNIQISFNISLFNSSDEPRGLQDIKVSFYESKKKSKFSIIPNDMATRKSTSYGSYTDELSVINLPPKTMVYYVIEAYISDKNVLKFVECNSIYFEVKDHKNKTVKHFIGNIRKP